MLLLLLELPIELFGVLNFFVDAGGVLFDRCDFLGQNLQTSPTTRTRGPRGLALFLGAVDFGLGAIKGRLQILMKSLVALHLFAHLQLPIAQLLNLLVDILELAFESLSFDFEAMLPTVEIVPARTRYGELAIDLG